MTKAHIKSILEKHNCKCDNMNLLVSHLKDEFDKEDLDKRVKIAKGSK